VKVLVAHNNAEVVAGPVVQEKKDVCGGKWEGEIGGYGFCCGRGDGLIEGFLLWSFGCAKVVAAENTVKRDKEERELLA